MSKADVLRIPYYLGHIVEAIERIDQGQLTAAEKTGGSQIVTNS
jgi:hypothetical protein